MSPCELWSQRALCVEMGFYVDISRDIKLRYFYEGQKICPSFTLYLMLLCSVKSYGIIFMACSKRLNFGAMVEVKFEVVLIRFR